jgi:hypothetical protein
MHTQYTHLSNRELILVVCNAGEPTPLELELMQRLSDLLDVSDDDDGGAD